VKTHRFKSEENKQEAIAIIAMVGKFPGANNVEEYWDNIKNCKESISFFSNEQLLITGVNKELIKNPKYVKAKGVIDDVDLFDADFFGYSPYEASITDPQHRLLLELSWIALEKAGYCSEKYNGQIGVFVGAGQSNYLYINRLKNGKYSICSSDYQSFIATSGSFISTKISYKLNLKGPSLNINTACSTSLVAIVTACKQLLNYECDMALAGGISIIFPQAEGYLYQKEGIPSPDGHCRAFDAQAAGTSLGAGAGVVVLKRLEDALNDGDNIEAIIIGSAINNDGADKAGFTAPSVIGQSRCIAEAIASAEISPESIGYIEAHGTGTPLGDTIEIAALTKVFNSKTNQKQFCAIGSAKTNIGHADCAAGVAGIIKIVFALKEKLLPPSLNFHKPNPNINFAESPFYVNTKLKLWQCNNKLPRRAGVSSFGIGGTNAHVVLEEAYPYKPHNNTRPVQILLLSAKTQTALKKATHNLCEFLKEKGTKKSLNDLADIAYTLQVGRKDFNCRRAILCKNVHEAIESFKNIETLEKFTHKNDNTHKQNIVFMFPGQGVQHPNMGIELYKTEPVFKQCVDNCCEILLEYMNFDFRKILFPLPKNRKYATEQLHKTEFTQPALFIIEYALAQLFINWGIKPHAVIGHSSGEYVAAHIAGVFSLKDALILVANRAKLIGQLESGIMLAVSLSENEILPLLSKDISLSAVNSPSWCVISGTHSAINKFKEKIKSIDSDRRIKMIKLQISHAFHSNMMKPMLNKFAAIIKTISTNSARIPFISTVMGKEISVNDLKKAAYWIKHIQNTVRFSDGVQELLKQQYNTFLEIGPGNTLVSLVSLHQHVSNITTLSPLPSAKSSPKKNQTASMLIYKTLAELWLKGAIINWDEFYSNEKRHRMPLPTYPFERQRYWLDTSITSDKLQQKGSDELDLHKECNKRDIMIKQKNNITVLEEKSQDKSIIEKIKTLFKEILGIMEVKDDDSFFDLGGHSLLALQLIFNLEKEFNVNIPLSVIYQTKTAASIAKIIVAPNIFSKPSSSPLVTIQEKGSKNPLFFIHPIGGTVFCYIPLVKYLSKQRPSFAIQDPNIDDNSLTFSNLEDVASFYICKIKDIQSKGPYLLCGSSYGGTVAFEMARQLHESGEQVEFVGLFDSWAIFSDIFYDRNFFEKVMNRQFKVLKSHLYTNIIKQKKSWFDLQWSRMQLLLNYKPRKTNINLTLFKSKDLLPQYNQIDEPKNHWQKYTSLPIKSYLIPGNHENILFEPHVQHLAHILQVCLNKVD